jgi:hypothetical protein
VGAGIIVAGGVWMPWGMAGLMTGAGVMLGAGLIVVGEEITEPLEPQVSHPPPQVSQEPHDLRLKRAFSLSRQLGLQVSQVLTGPHVPQVSTGASQVAQLVLWGKENVNLCLGVHESQAGAAGAQVVQAGAAGAQVSQVEHFEWPNLGRLNPLKRLCLGAHSLTGPQSPPQLPHPPPQSLDASGAETTGAGDDTTGAGADITGAGIGAGEMIGAGLEIGGSGGAIAGSAPADHAVEISRKAKFTSVFLRSSRT